MTTLSRVVFFDIVISRFCPAAPPEGGSSIHALLGESAAGKWLASFIGQDTALVTRRAAFDSPGQHQAPVA